jgi:hypothetical protein
VKKGLVFFFLGQLLPILLFANAADTSLKVYDSRSVRYLYQRDTHDDTLQFRALDTTSLGFQNFNPIQADNVPRLYLGNLGLAYKTIVLEERQDIGFNYGRNAYDIYLKRADDMEYYRVFSPYTNFNYFWNRRKEQLFNFTLSQNFGPRFNYAVNFNRLVSLGDYDRQKSDHLNYDISVWYTSRNRRYQVYSAFIVNDLLLQENGGVQSDSIFTNSSGVTSEVEPVFLQGASNQISDKHFFLKQSIALGQKDTIRLDSLTYTRVRAKWRVSHELLANERVDTYKEVPRDTNLYNDVFVDSVNTNDRIGYFMLQNKVGLERYLKSGSSKRSAYLGFYAQQQVVNVENTGRADVALASVQVQADMKLQLAEQLELVVKYAQGVAGDYSGNYNVNAVLNHYFANDKNYVRVFANVNRSAASYFAGNYSSNHFLRNISLRDFQEITLGTLYHNEKAEADFGVKLIRQQYVTYFDELIAVQQLEEQNYVHAFIGKTFHWGPVALANTINLQYSSASNVVRLPLLHTYQSLYFQRHLFNKALYLRTGFDVRYFTSMDAYAYDPANAEFYLSKKTVGDFPVVDYFVTLGLKRAVLLLKVDHLSQGLGRLGNNMIPGHPLPDRGLKIGLRWAFYD